MATVTTSPREFRAASLKLVQSSRLATRLARWLIVLLTLAVVAMVFVPWQQTARGTGRMVALNPQERPQSVTSPVKGVVLTVEPGLIEGTAVTRGQRILEIQPNAANLVEQIRGQIADLEAKRDTAEAKVTAYQNNIRSYTEARDFAVAAADQLIAATVDKLDGKRAMLPGYRTKEWQTRVNYERQAGLQSKGVRSSKEVEYLQVDWDLAKSNLENLEKEIASLEKELEAKRKEREEKFSKGQANVDYAIAMMQDALGQVATAEKEIKDNEIKLAELERLIVTAPCDGRLFRIRVTERGQALKEGDELFTIVPDTSALAVELSISGNDTPLVHVGEEVRLQFEGWPAIQFAGWPSVAVGTFGGRVIMIDPTDDGTGKFRVLVEPDGDWPSEQYLRQGVRANGWVLLDQVTLGFELWRQLNGFPPTYSKAIDKDKDQGKTKIKLPK